MWLPKENKHARKSLHKRSEANALEKVKRLCKEFDFTVGTLNGALAIGRNEK